MKILLALIAVELGIIIYAVLWIVGFLSELKNMNNAYIEFEEASEDEDGRQGRD